MAERALFESFLSCHVCSETFRDPVSLSCNHSFCSSCLQKFWEQAKNKNCPICKTKSLIDEPALNFTLKELADSFAGRQKNDSPETEKEKEKEEVVCDKHPDVSYWFCKDEDRAVCPVCEFSLHQSHKVVPIEQAVSELKDQLKCDLKSLQDKRDKYKQVEETYNEVIQHSKKQLLFTERQIRAEFNKLQQFLKEEEESRLAALREEEEERGKTISREMKMIEEQISSLGLAKESVDRKGERYATPKYGIWCVKHRSGKYFDVVGETVTVKKSLQRIRVQLDYDRGEVSFYNPEDMTHICTHRDTFTEKLFPYFCVIHAGDAKTADIKMCHTEISL